jgi:transposase
VCREKLGACGAGAAPRRHRGDAAAPRSPLWLPSRAPELNPLENIWQDLRANWLSNRLFETFDEIIDAI